MPKATLNLWQESPAAHELFDKLYDLIREATDNNKVTRREALTIIETLLVNELHETGGRAAAYRLSGALQGFKDAEGQFLQCEAPNQTGDALCDQAATITVRGARYCAEHAAEAEIRLAEDPDWLSSLEPTDVNFKQADGATEGDLPWTFTGQFNTPQNTNELAALEKERKDDKD